MKRLTSDLPETYPLLTPSWTIRGLPEWIRPHGVWQNSDQNKPILWMSNSKRVKVEGGWLGPTCSVPSEVNQISFFLPFPTCGEEWAEPWVKYKARYMISSWKDPPPSDQQSVSQQCGEPQAGSWCLAPKGPAQLRVTADQERALHTWPELPQPSENKKNEVFMLWTSLIPFTVPSETERHTYTHRERASRPLSSQLGKHPQIPK